MKITIELDATRARRALRGAAVLGLVAGLAYPAWLAAAQISGLVTFSPGETIKAADFNQNFQLIETAVNDADSKVTTLSSTVTGVQGQVSGLQGQVGTVQGQVGSVQGQVSALQAQNASLLARLNVVEALTVAGVPDRTLGGKGFALGTLGTTQQPAAFTVDASGRTVVTGLDFTSALRMFLCRYNPDGTLDLSFAKNGFFLETVSSSGGAVGVDASGKIVVAGTATAAHELTVWRFDANGTRDATFGTGGMTSTTSPGTSLAAYGLAIDSTGRILVTGSSLPPTATTTKMTTWRFDANGALDLTFNGTGSVVDPTTASSLATAVAVDSSGNIVIVGNPNSNMGVWRYTTTGTIDTTFNGTGYYFDPPIGFGRAIAFDASGRILVAGYAGNPVIEMAVWRLTAAGTLDPSFGTGGLFTSLGTGTSATANSMIIDAAGRIVVAGSSNVGATITPTVWRVTAGGQVDPTFGAGLGYATNPALPLSGNVPNGVAIDATGKILAGDRVAIPGGTAFALIRYD